MPNCGVTFSGAPHTAWVKQGYTTQPHTCDLPVGHEGAHTCTDEADHPIVEGV